MKKILTITLSLAIIIGLIFIIPNQVNADEVLINDGIIVAGDTKTVTIENGGDNHYFTFTPDETTYYRFHSEGDLDTYGYIYTNENEQLAYNDDSGERSNFEIFYTLEKDITYKLRVKCYSEETTGNFTVKLAKITTIEDGAISTGTTFKSISDNEWHIATFTPSEDGLYNFTLNANNDIDVKFHNWSNSGRSKHQANYELEKDITYDIVYHATDYTASLVEISINKYSSTSKGNLSVGTEYTITNNNANEYFEYTFNITRSNRYFIISSYDNAESENFGFNIYDSENSNVSSGSGDGSYRLDILDVGTYKLKLFLYGTVKFKIIGQTAINQGVIKVDEPKNIEFNGLAQRYNFTFTPTESAIYDLYGDDNSLDTYAYLYDNNGKQITYNDDSGENQNFKISYYLEKNKIYTLSVELYSPTKTGTVRVNVVSNTSHEHNYYNNTTYPTCTEKGYTTHRCYNCGHTYIDNYVDALGHDWNSGYVTDPTCTEKGYTTHYCNRCGEEHIDTYVDALGHTWNVGVTTAPTCTEKGYTTYHCTVCGEEKKDDYINALGHTIENKTTKKATVNENGYVKGKCSKCESEVTETIFKPEYYTLSKNSFTYNKKVQKPTVTVKDSKGYIINPSNYTVTYSNNSSKKVGEYKVIITFKGDKYEGSKTVTYQIVPKGTKISKLKAAKKKFTATWKKQTQETTGYQIQYSTSKNFTSENKTANITKNKTTSKAISKLKAKKKYYVRVRTYKKVNGKKIYSGWSSVKAVTTKK